MPTQRLFKKLQFILQKPASALVNRSPLNDYSPSFHSAASTPDPISPQTPLFPVDPYALQDPFRKDDINPDYPPQPDSERWEWDSDDEREPCEADIDRPFDRAIYEHQEQDWTLSIGSRYLSLPFASQQDTDTDSTESRRPSRAHRHKSSPSPPPVALSPAPSRQRRITSPSPTSPLPSQSTIPAFRPKSIPAPQPMPILTTRDSRSSSLSSAYPESSSSCSSQPADALAPPALTRKVSFADSNSASTYSASECLDRLCQAFPVDIPPGIAAPSPPSRPPPRPLRSSASFLSLPSLSPPDTPVSSVHPDKNPTTGPHHDHEQPLPSQPPPSPTASTSTRTRRKSWIKTKRNDSPFPLTLTPSSASLRAASIASSSPTVSTPTPTQANFRSIGRPPRVRRTLDSTRTARVERAMERAFGALLAAAGDVGALRDVFSGGHGGKAGKDVGKAGVEEGGRDEDNESFYTAHSNERDDGWF